MIALPVPVRNFSVGTGPVIPLRCFPENTVPESATGHRQLSYKYGVIELSLDASPGDGTPHTGSEHSIDVHMVKKSGTPGSGNADPLNRQADYARQFSSLTHDLRTNGTFELPIGPNKIMLGNSSGWVARMVERWQASIIYNVSSGTPNSVTAGALNYAGTAQPDVVGPWDVRTGKLQWDGSEKSGILLRQSQSVSDRAGPSVRPDPECRGSDRIQPGHRQLWTHSSCPGRCARYSRIRDRLGHRPFNTCWSILSLERREIWGSQQSNLPGSIDSMQTSAKTFRIDEQKSIQVRVDATNVLNHPQIGAPNFSIKARISGWSRRIRQVAVHSRARCG